MGFGGFESIFFTMFTIAFIAILGMIIARAIKGGLEWNKNNNSPVLTVDAVIVTKRTEINGHTHYDTNTSMHHNSSSTTYYATFEVESGDRLEIRIPTAEYGMLVERDQGRLTFQGTRYIRFDRFR